MNGASTDSGDVVEQQGDRVDDPEFKTTVGSEGVIIDSVAAVKPDAGKQDSHTPPHGPPSATLPPAPDTVTNVVDGDGEVVMPAV